MMRWYFVVRQYEKEAILSEQPRDISYKKETNYKRSLASSAK